MFREIKRKSRRKTFKESQKNRVLMHWIKDKKGPLRLQKEIRVQTVREVENFEKKPKGSF